MLATNLTYTRKDQSLVGRQLVRLIVASTVHMEERLDARLQRHRLAVYDLTTAMWLCRDNYMGN